MGSLANSKEKNIMRTIILVSAYIIAMAIVQTVEDYDIQMDESMAKFVFFVFMFCVVMDIAEFVKNMLR